MDTEWFLPRDSTHNTPASQLTPSQVLHGDPNQAQNYDDHLLLSQIQHGIYDGDSLLEASQSGNQNLHQDLPLDAVDYIVPEDLGANSKAYPPLSYPQNTPALGPRSQSVLKTAPINLPILPSQNERLYNEEHYLRRQQQQHNLGQPQNSNEKALQNHHSQAQNGHKTLSSTSSLVSNAHLNLTHSTQSRAPILQNRQHLYTDPFDGNHVRPEAVFTPLVLPAVTPLEELAKLHFQQAAVPTNFEPLTLPALNAQPLTREDRRRSLLATFGAEDYANGNSSKRRTPHSTPNMAAHPGAKLKRLPLLRTTPQTETLPETTQVTSVTPSLKQEPPESWPHDLMPMLPPLGKKVPIDTLPGNSGGTPLGNANSGVGGVGPGTLMGFTMNRLAEQQSTRSNSPSPSLGPQNLAKGLHRSTRPEQVLSYHLVNQGLRGGGADSSSSETSPMLEAQNGEYSSYLGKREKHPAKKASHKLAEQGRRNRMNHAVAELSKLIPDQYHEQVAIPSKATTVELAATYIQHLTREIDHLRYKLHNTDS